MPLKESAIPRTGIVVIPTYNERENLPHLVPAILAYPDLRVLVVDDDSPDGTRQAAEQLIDRFPGRISVLNRTGPRGLGRSLIDGFLQAIETDVDVVIQMDADLSHDPSYLPDLIAATATCDLVIGSRYMDGISVRNWPLRRIALSVAANVYVRVVMHLPVRDCTSGYRCWQRSALAQLPLKAMVSDGYAFQVEMLYRAYRAGHRVCERPIVFVDRRHGHSKMSVRIIAESIALPWTLR